MRRFLVVFLCGFAGHAAVAESLRMVDACRAAGEVWARCVCGQTVADKILSPEMQDITAITMSTGTPPVDKMAEFDITLTEIMQQWESWSDAVEKACGPASDLRSDTPSVTPGVTGGDAGNDAPSKLTQ